VCIDISAWGMHDEGMTNANIRDSQISQLVADAGRHGDHVTVIVGRIALNEENTITASSWEERYGGGGFQDYEREAVLKFGATVAAARNMMANQWQAWILGGLQER